MNPETGLPEVEAVEATEKKTRKPRAAKAIEVKGYTKVAEGTHGIVAAARKWEESQVTIESNSLYVKNEFINWEAFRDQGVLIPASEQPATPSVDPNALNGAIDPNVPVPVVV